MISSLNTLPPSVLHEFFSYLFHEIISPVSALLTGVELLEGEGSYSQELLDILKHSSQTLRARLEFFRAALGGGGVSLSPKQVQHLLKKLWEGEAVPPIVFQTTVETFPRGVGQKVLLLALCLAQRKKFSDPSYVLFYEDGSFSAKIQEALISFEDLMVYLLTPEASDLPKADPSAFLLELLQLAESNVA